jgi:hypothetical protein
VWWQVGSGGRGGAGAVAVVQAVQWCRQVQAAGNPDPFTGHTDPSRDCRFQGTCQCQDPKSGLMKQLLHPRASQCKPASQVH